MTSQELENETSIYMIVMKTQCSLKFIFPSAAFDEERRANHI